MNRYDFLIVLCYVLAIFPFKSLPDQPRPLVDYHQHLFSPAAAKLSPGVDPITSSDLVALLDSAGIRRALVLSVAYQFANPNRPPTENEYAAVKAENDWTSRQVAGFPDRLRGFCSVNPLKDYALQEIERCAKDPQLNFGLKLHFGNSDVDLENPQPVEQLRRVFRAANDHRMAIVVHMRSSVTKQRRYGANSARAFLNNLLPAAPDVPVQIAHLTGAGGYDDPLVDEALSVFVRAIANRDPRMAHVYFDVSGVAGLGKWVDKAGLIATRIRELGVARILYGSDGAARGNTPLKAWTVFRQLPLSDAEFRTIENNIAPHMR
jgi:predicted TIM-barrel fold metal-dependent hydrolase